MFQIRKLCTSILVYFIMDGPEQWVVTNLSWDQAVKSVKALLLKWQELHSSMTMRSLIKLLACQQGPDSTMVIVQYFAMLELTNLMNSHSKVVIHI